MSDNNNNYNDNLFLSIIIINYRTPDLTLSCISSIYNYPILFKYEIIVVDNYSCDNSHEKICSVYPDVIWIQNNANEGFGRANNLGVYHSKGQFILFLNSDVIVLENSINYSLEAIIKDKNIGVLGCKLLNFDGSHQQSTYSCVGEYKAILEFSIWYDYFIKNKKQKHISALMGAFLLIPRIIFDKVKGFDPDYFMYAEDFDLCYRIEKFGYKLVYFDKAEVIHLQGGSTNSNFLALTQSRLSNSLLYLKSKGYVGYFVYHFFYQLMFLTNFIVLWKVHKDVKKFNVFHFKCYIRNFFYYLTIPILFKPYIGNGDRILKRKEYK